MPTFYGRDGVNGIVADPPEPDVTPDPTATLEAQAEDFTRPLAPLTSSELNFVITRTRDAMARDVGPDVVGLCCDQALVQAAMDELHQRAGVDRVYRTLTGGA
jgi:hypothetical protein